MLLYLILITLILLCWGGGYYGWNVPNGRPVGSILGLCGLVLLIVLILMLIGVGSVNSPSPTYINRP
jgi:hypothetical protein